MLLWKLLLLMLWHQPGQPELVWVQLLAPVLLWHLLLLQTRTVMAAGAGQQGQEQRVGVGVVLLNPQEWGQSLQTQTQSSF
jgi:hypothetical protein